MGPFNLISVGSYLEMMRVNPSYGFASCDSKFSVLTRRNLYLLESRIPAEEDCGWTYIRHGVKEIGDEYVQHGAVDSYQTPCLCDSS